MANKCLTEAIKLDPDNKDFTDAILKINK